jgi:hypothetical protein
VLQYDGNGLATFTRDWYRWFSLFQTDTMGSFVALDSDPLNPEAMTIDPVLSNAIADLERARTEIAELRELVFEQQKAIQALQIGVVL